MNNMNTIKSSSSAGIQHKHANKALLLLSKKGIMHRFELMSHLGMTISQMIPFNAYLEYALSDHAEYNRQTKEWTMLDPVEKPIIDDPEQEGIVEEE